MEGICETCYTRANYRRSLDARKRRQAQVSKRLRGRRSASRSIYNINYRRTHEASYAYRATTRAALICNRSRIIQGTGGTVQRALVTVTSSGTTFLTLARARPALGAPSPSPFVSLPPSLYSPVRRFPFHESWPPAREGYERCEGSCKTPKHSRFAVSRRAI